ncbi:MAG: hypothetical protein HQL36_04650 [Alphaproteobacteria bacterium]|nr:hypothetical protein [Alphaproteobacteria bacterium]MBF0250753.1 hypothetical protein [Alphaproteobacteria bacterium]
MYVEAAVDVEQVWAVKERDAVVSVHPHLSEALRACQSGNGGPCKVCLNHVCQFHARMDVAL